MPGPLLATKIHAPALRPGLVERATLLARLQRGAQSRLTLISAPAGFGKTSLLAAHVAALGSSHSVAWLSLDAGDNEPLSFWSHILAALQSAARELGTEMLAALTSGEPPSEALLATLINDLHAHASTVTIVLDDYHLIEATAVHDGVGFLLEHLPPNAHLVVSTRADPPLALARLRARRDLVEIRAADLRFTADESQAYLNGSMNLGLGSRDVATLTQRTEGWIAALQLAALSLEGRQDTASFIESFAGNDRYIVDYLLEEVLHRQPEPVRRFLMQTCILERLNGSLCDAVTGGGGGAAMLETLDRANLFVVPLDSTREWFRYHHLFADVLQAHFAAELRDQLAALHRRASDWYAQHGSQAEAIQHALAGGHAERAADLIETVVAEMRRIRQEARLRVWIEALPRDLVRRRPVLALGLVGALASLGKFEGTEDLLRESELLLAETPAQGAQPLAADPAFLKGLPAAIELYRAAIAQVRGDTPQVVVHAQRCIALSPKDDGLVSAGAHGFLGIAFWSAGDLEAGQKEWSHCRDGLRGAGHLADVFGASIALADINQTLGRLRAAARTYEDALELSAAQRGYIPRGTADLHAGLSELHWASGDLDLANQHLMRSQELGEGAGLPQFPHRWRIAMAKLRQTTGDAEAALDLLDEAERLYVPDFFPNVRPIAAMKARVLIRQDRLAEAARWHHEANVEATDQLTYLREFEHVTLARLLLAQGALDEALVLLHRLLAAAQAGGRLGSVIEISILQVLAQHARRDDAATASLDRALTLAAPEGYVRVFVDEGEPMDALLNLAAKKGSTFARSLLVAFDPAAEVHHSPEELLEPLSERELDVLRLLRSDLDGPDIARELGVSLNTMRTHTKNIYEKLGVSSRRTAVRRAEKLGLLRP